MVFDKQQEGQQRDQHNAHKHCPALGSEIDEPCHACHKQQQPEHAGTVDLLLYFVQLGRCLVNQAQVVVSDVVYIVHY